MQAYQLAALTARVLHSATSANAATDDQLTNLCGDVLLKVAFEWSCTKLRLVSSCEYSINSIITPH
jgi:hypothetical protein